MQAILANSTCFPGFLKAINTSFVSSSLMKKCEIKEIIYKPNVSCVIRYELWTELEQRSILVAELLKEEQRSFHETNYSEQFHANLYFFPNDPILVGLSDILDKKQMKSSLSDVFSKNILDLQMTLLSYKPFNRATIQFKITFKNSYQSVIAKTNVKKSTKTQFHLYEKLWKEMGQRIRMPEPVAFLEEYPLTLQKKIEGVRLSDLVRQKSFLKAFEQTADSLAYFHRQIIPTTIKRKLNTRILLQNSDVLTSLVPEWKERVTRLKETLILEMESRYHPNALIHGDFHPSNILVAPEGVSFVDLDDVLIGDPCIDIGRILSSLRLPFYRCFGSLDFYYQHREHFLNTYLELVQRDPKDIFLFEAGSLITSAASAFRYQSKNWRQEADLLLNEVEWLLNEK